MPSHVMGGSSVMVANSPLRGLLHPLLISRFLRSFHINAGVFVRLQTASALSVHLDTRTFVVSRTVLM